MKIRKKEKRKKLVFIVFKKIKENKMVLNYPLKLERPRTGKFTNWSYVILKMSQYNKKKAPFPFYLYLLCQGKVT